MLPLFVLEKAHLLPVCQLALHCLVSQFAFVWNWTAALALAVGLLSSGDCGGMVVLCL